MNWLIFIHAEASVPLKLIYVWKYILCVCHCSWSGGCAFAAVSAAQAVHPEGSTGFALPPGQTPTDTFSASRHRRLPKSYRCNDPFMIISVPVFITQSWTTNLTMKLQLGLNIYKLTVMYWQWLKQNCVSLYSITTPWWSCVDFL